jgi:hypothetical protein
LSTLVSLIAGWEKGYVDREEYASWRNIPTSTADGYVSSTRSVLQAATQLREALDADAARIEFAITDLERAAEQQQSGATNFRSFMFSELDTASEPEDTLRERLAEDTLATVSADLHVASTLIAAGVTVGEVGPETTSDRLDEAILRWIT